MAGIGRPNQRLRTRKALLEAAARLARTGVSPSLDKVAEAALVSRATAYRYFPSVEMLMAEAALDVAAPDPETLFRDENGDPSARLIKADKALDAMIGANEPALRAMLARSLTARGPDGDAPRRQNRRSQLIDKALEPARRSFRAADFKMLKRALALILGTEARIVFKDVLEISDEEARAVKNWAIRNLILAAERKD